MQRFNKRWAENIKRGKDDFTVRARRCRQNNRSAQSAGFAAGPEEMRLYLTIGGDVWKAKFGERPVRQYIGRDFQGRYRTRINDGRLMGKADTDQRQRAKNAHPCGSLCPTFGHASPDVAGDQ